MTSCVPLTRRTVWVRRWIYLVVGLSVLAVILAILGRAATVRAQSDSGLWNDPVNISSSGSATSATIAAESNGQIHVMWWDKFDGTKYSYRGGAGSWSKPANIPGIFGQRVRTQGGKIELSPPTEMILLANGKRQVFAFWRATTGDLMYARTGTAHPSWSGGVRLVTNPVAWRVYVAGDNSINLVYIRGSSTTNTEPGIYFRRSKDGTSWSDPAVVTRSLYFRTLASSDVSLSLAADGSGQVIVGWDDPQTRRSYFARSPNRGAKFGAAEIVEAGGIAEVAVPRHVRFVPLTGPGFMRLWEAGDGCVLYQQTSAADGTWSAPVRAIEKANGCLRTDTAFAASDGRLFLTVGSAYYAQNTLTAWDGAGWTEPLAPEAGFLNPATNSSVTLGCVTLTVTADSVVLMGCDVKGDVWVLTSRLPPETFLPEAQSSWDQPVVLSKGAGDAGLPSLAIDQQNRFHVVWSQLPAPGYPGATLAYIRSNGAAWTDVANIIRVPVGTVDTANLLVDPDEVLHVIWSGGATGQVQYNQAFMRDALVASDWGEPRPMPARQPVGDSPNIALGMSGKLYVLYTIPFNEDRGLYFVVSSDLGQTWSSPVRVFDAAAAGWGVIHQAELLVDRQEHLHVAFARAAVPDQESPQGIYYSQSTDGGATWTGPIAVRSDTDSRPKLVSAGDNVLHLVWAHATSNGFELIHEWSPDSGQTWSPPNRIPGLGVVAPEVGLAADSTGSVYLTGVELTREASAGIFFLRWNGQVWTDREGVRLGYDFNDAMGARMAILPSGQLGVFYRARVPDGTGGTKYVVGYVGRRLAGQPEFTPAPTFTPRPSATALPTPTPAPTLTPISLPSAGSSPVGSAGVDEVLVQIGIVVAVMVLISAVAIIRLWGRIGR